MLVPAATWSRKLQLLSMTAPPPMRIGPTLPPTLALFQVLVPANTRRLPVMSCRSVPVMAKPPLKVARPVPLRMPRCHSLAPLTTSAPPPPSPPPLSSIEPSDEASPKLNDPPDSVSRPVPATERMT
jgi:hypothetical protein